MLILINKVALPRMIRRKCKYCKLAFWENETTNEESKNYCLVCWFKKDMKECREARRKALGLKYNISR